MKKIKQTIYSIQRDLRDLNFQLNSKDIELSLFIQEMIECLSFICGYSDRALEGKFEEE